MRTRDLATTARAQALRAASTEAERKIWRSLRDRRLMSAKFIRQAPVGLYFADFLCRDARLVVELDGGQHAEAGADERRDALLAQQGYAVLRFWNHDAINATSVVLDTIAAALEGRLEPYERYRLPASRDSLLPARGEKGAEGRMRGGANLSGEACAAPHPGPLPVSRGEGERAEKQA